MTEQHSPGPWQAEGDSWPIEVWQLMTADRAGVRLATVSSTVPGGGDQAWANALLMAAAPDLLDAIWRWLDYDDVDLLDRCEYGLTDTDECKGDAPGDPVCPACQLRTAIAKATGEAHR